MGAHDDCIYVYGVSFEVTKSERGRVASTAASCVLRALQKLRGHSSTIHNLGALLHASLPLHLYLRALFLSRLECGQPVDAVRLQRPRAPVSPRRPILVAFRHSFSLSIIKGAGISPQAR